MHSYRKYFRCYLPIGLGAALFTLLLYLGVMQLIGNFHAVEEGKVYRSAQLSIGQLDKYAQRYHIKTILNLRGENAGKPWYEAEKELAAKAGIQHIDFRMSAKRELEQERAEELIAIMRDAPKPLLIHCRAGADRSGLASALYVAAVEKGDEEAAEMQLTPIYGHISLPVIGMPAMDETFERMEPWLGYHNS